MEKLNYQSPLANLENKFLKKDLPVLKIGDNLKVGVKIIEGNKERVQFYTPNPKPQTPNPKPQLQAVYRLLS